MLQQETQVDFTAFANAVEASERKNTQDNARKSGFPVPDCCAIGNRAIVRFINGIPETALDRGKPGSGRAQLFNMGWVKDDNDKLFPLCLPAIVNNKPMYPSTMLEFIDKVLARTWVEDPTIVDDKGRVAGAWKYFYEERDDYGQQKTGEMTLKDIFWKVFKSGVPQTDPNFKKARSWRGQTVYIANVIDRLDYAWHQQNKKTKLLMRKVTVKGDGTIRPRQVSHYAIGAPLKNLCDNHGYDLNYDVLIIPGVENTDKFTLMNVSEYKKINYWKEVPKDLLTEADKEKISTNVGLTDEEITWDPIDINQFYRFTSAKVILDHFGKTIKNFDMMVGTNFYEKLQHEAELDARANNATANATANATSQAAPQPVAQPMPQPAAQPVNPAPVAPAAPVYSAQPTTAPVNPAPVTAQPITQPVVQPAGAPAPLEPSPSAKADIDDFYASLE